MTGLGFASSGGVTSLMRYEHASHPDPAVRGEQERYLAAQARGDRPAILAAHTRLRELYAAYAGKDSPR